MNDILGFELPWPPTTNNLFYTDRKDRSRRLTARARSYVKAVGDQVLEASIPRFTLAGRLGCSIIAHPPDYRARDLDNLFKAPLDALKKAGVIADDADFDVLRIARGAVVDGGRLHVQLYSVSNVHVAA